MQTLNATFVTPRIVAVGDLHGDLEGAVRVLCAAGVLGRDARWSGGNSTTLVQTGDLTDRGSDSREVMDLMMALQRDAPAGKVIQLLGNHEVMNLHGDWRYVHPEEISRWPGGAAARREALGPDGHYGKWLRSLPVAARVGRTVFAHAGLLPEVAALGLHRINQLAKEELFSVSRARFPLTGGADGPLWTRKLALPCLEGAIEDCQKACKLLSSTLALLEADRMAVGHTTTWSGQPESFCSGALILIDVGISHAYGGHRAAIEMAHSPMKAALRHILAD